MTHRICIAIFLGVAFLSCSPASAATLNGRLTTSLYTWERQEADTSSSSHLRAYQSVTLDVGELGDRRLSFHTYALVTGDVSGSGNRGQRFRLYNVYLQWKDGGRTPAEVSAGRQRIYEGVGYGTVDGLRVSIRPRGMFTLTGYGGTLAPLVTKARLEDWSDGHMWGARLTTERLWNSSVGLSFVHRNRRPLPYLAPGRYSGQRFDVTSAQQQLAGLDVHRTFGQGVDLYVRFDYDILGKRTRQTEGIVRVSASEHLTVAFEGIRRAPVINANSIFSVFDVEDSEEYAVRGNYTVNHLASIYGNFAEVVYDGARAQRIGFGFGFGSHSVNYTRRIGEGGDNDAVSVNLARRVNRFVTLRADGGLASYQLNSRVGKKLTALSGALGITCRPHRRVSLDAEAQVLRDRIYANDLRFFFRGTVWFFSGQKRR